MFIRMANSNDNQFAELNYNEQSSPKCRDNQHRRHRDSISTIRRKYKIDHPIFLIRSDSTVPIPGQPEYKDGLINNSFENTSDPILPGSDESVEKGNII